MTTAKNALLLSGSRVCCFLSLRLTEKKPKSAHKTLLKPSSWFNTDHTNPIFSFPMPIFHLYIRCQLYQRKNLDQSPCPCSRILITNLSQPVFPFLMISFTILSLGFCIFLLSHTKHSPLHNVQTYYLSFLQMSSLVLCLSMVTSRWLANTKVKLLILSLLAFLPLTCLSLPFVCEHWSLL